MQVRLLREREVRERIGVGRSTLYKMLADGVLPVIHIGRLMRVPSDALEQWLAQKSVESLSNMIIPLVPIAPDSEECAPAALPHNDSPPPLGTLPIYTCSECGSQFSSKRRFRAGLRRFCDACRRAGVAQKYAARDAYWRRKSLTLSTEGNDPTTIANTLGVSVDEVIRLIARTTGRV